jgi:hypothetical protein
MQRHSLRRASTLLVVVILAFTTVACADQDVEEDPRGALRDAVMAFRDYSGIELTIGAQLDDAAQASARTEGDFSEEQLALLTDSSLTVRGVEGDGDDDGQSEFVLVVGDETVLTVRALADYELYALIDLPAVERVADALDAEGDFRQSLAQFEQMAGMFGLGQVMSAARDAEWIRIAGLQQMVEMAEEQAPEEDQPDEADLEAMAREIGERLLEFLEDDEVQVAHVGSDDVGERVRITATGVQLRELAVDLVESLDDVAGADPTALGMQAPEVRAELEDAIPDDVEISLHAWIDGGELSQVAVDVFDLARAADADDVPDGEFLIAVAISEFDGSIEAPDTDVTFDVFEIFGAMMGDLGGLGADPFAEDPFADEDVEELPDEQPGEDLPDDQPGLDEDFCVTEEELEQLLEQMPEEQRDLDEDEFEEMFGVPIC